MKNFKKFTLQSDEAIYINPALISSFRSGSSVNGITGEKKSYTKISITAGPELCVMESLEQTIAILES